MPRTPVPASVEQTAPRGRVPRVDELGAVAAAREPRRGTRPSRPWRRRRAHRPRADRAGGRAACRGRRSRGRAARPAERASRGCRSRPRPRCRPVPAWRGRDGDPGSAAARAAPGGESPGGRHQVGEDRLEIGRERVACVHSPPLRVEIEDLQGAGHAHARRRSADAEAGRHGAEVEVGDDPQLERATLAGVKPGELARERARQLGRVGAGGHLVPVRVVVRAGGDAEPLGGVRSSRARRWCWRTRLRAIPHSHATPAPGSRPRKRPSPSSACANASAVRSPAASGGTWVRSQAWRAGAQRR